MSELIFNSMEGEVSVRGNERPWFDKICREIFIALLDLHNGSFERMRSDGSEIHRFLPNPFRSALPFDHYTHEVTGDKWEDQVRTALCVDSEDLKLNTKKGKINASAAVLNTALFIGGDALKFVARVHGQCEFRLFVEGYNRKWLTNIIGAGLSHKGIFRKNAGWEDVVALLKSSEKTPLVISYDEYFPDSFLAEREGVWTAPKKHDKDDAWNELPKEQQWSTSMEALRKVDKRRNIELTPENWNSFYFRKNINVFDILNYCNGSVQYNKLYDSFSWKKS